MAGVVKELVDMAKQYLVQTRDNKYYVSHQQIHLLLSYGAHVRRRDAFPGLIEVEYEEVVFVHSCTGCRPPRGPSLVH